jgi:hypothetical protein
MAHPPRVVRFHALFAVVIWLVLLMTNCRPTTQAPQQPPSPTKPPETISDAELRDRQDRIRKYFEERHQRRKIVATTVTDSGQIIDWIRPESQTPDGVIAESPAFKPEEKAPSQDEATLPIKEAQKTGADQISQTEVQTQERARGPKGTVPIVRFNVEAYLDSVGIPPKDVREVLQKIPPPAPDSNDRYYVVWQRFGTFFGTAGRINIWDTTGPVGNETSIAQTAVIRGNPMQAIEAGKIEVQSLNGNRRPHLFTYYRTNGTAQGDWVAGYNTLVDGWIQVSPSVAPGMSLTPWQSSENGNQFSLDVEVRIHQGNWWVWAAGQWAGYYPVCSGGDAPPCDSGNLFSENGIRSQADRLDWYGEVFDSSAPAATSTDMGSGAFADTWWQHAAYFRNVTFFWQPATYWWWNSGSIGPTDTACYTVNGPHYSNDPAWRNWFFYGGPGREADRCR